MNKFIELINSRTTDSVGTSKNRLIDRNGIFYHVIQQTDNRTNLFSGDAARHRDGLLKNMCPGLGIVPIINVIMPTHTHDVFLTDDVEKIRFLFRNLNRGTFVFIRNERAEKFRQSIQTVFANQPGYVVIKTREQFFCLIKYLYDNPAYLRQNGEFIPYSCFDAWEKGYFKPYKIELFYQIFGIKIEEILKYCHDLNKDEFYSFAKEKYRGDGSTFSNEMFKKDVRLPWLTEQTEQT